MHNQRCRRTVEERVMFAYGETGSERSERFAAHLKGCPDCRSEVERLSRSAELCRQVREARLPEPVWSKPLPFEPGQRAPRVARVWWLWVPATVVTAVALLWLALGRPWSEQLPVVPTSEPPGSPQTQAPLLALKTIELTGEVRLRRVAEKGFRPFSESSTLRAGDELATSNDARIGLELADGSCIRLGDHSRLRIDAVGVGGDRLFLLGGTLACQVRPRSTDRPFSVDAGPGRVVVRGTRFAIQLFAEGWLSVGVAAGAVELVPLGAGRETVFIRAGQQARLGPDGGPIRLGRLRSDAAQLMAPPQPAAPQMLADRDAKTKTAPTVASRRQRPMPRDAAPVESSAKPVRPEALRGERRAKGDDSLESLVAHLYRDTTWIFDELRAELQGGRFESVLRKLDNYLADPDSPNKDEATFLKAVCLEKLGRSAKARQTYREYRRQWPTGRRAKDALKGILRLQP